MVPGQNPHTGTPLGRIDILIFPDNSIPTPLGSPRFTQSFGIVSDANPVALHRNCYGHIIATV